MTDIFKDHGGFGGQESAAHQDGPAAARTPWYSIFRPETWLGAEAESQMPRLTPQLRAHLLYEYCVASEKTVSESVHSLYIIAEHYAAENPAEFENPETINGIPPFFTTLTAKEKSDFCYNQVTEALALEAMPVTVESLRATKRRDPNDPWSSYAGHFVRRVTGYVVFSLLAILALYLLGFKYLNLFATPDGDLSTEGMTIQGIAFGCIGALVHLLNYALTTTRLETFELSEARKIRPRLLLGGIFGFIVPTLLTMADLPQKEITTAGPLVAFLAGYSVRFSTGLLERLMAAVMPETKPKR